MKDLITPRRRLGKIRAVSIVLLLASGIPGAASAALSTNPQDAVRSLYDTLLGTMKDSRKLGQVDAMPGWCPPRLTGLMVGAADMAADLGAKTAWEPLLFARFRLIAACALAGITPIDAPFFDIRDEAGLQHGVAAAVAFGFSAKAAIHPSQVDAINAALTPTQEAVDRARAILAENAKGVGTVGGQMIDEAIARTARRVLAAAGVAG
jgi:(S)-citramalyl-CoA lyase